MAYKKKEKPGIMLYWTAFDALEDMVDGEAKEMLRAMRMYAQYGETPDFSDTPSLRTVWIFMKDFLDRDDANYNEICKKNSENGKRSAEKRWGHNVEQDNDRYSE